jgi:hypothetical protein
MFRPNWPSSGIQVKNSTVHCNAIFFSHIIVVSRYFGYVGYHQLPEATTIGGKETALQSPAKSITITTYTAEDGQLDINM